jgi:alpha-galactosidase
MATWKIMRSGLVSCALALAFGAATPAVYAQDAHPHQMLASTPPMGWNSWNAYGAKIDDKIIRATADAMVSSGLSKAGYEYINLDDSWEGGRDAAGNIVPNANFPDMKALADYIHAKGLKFGIYTAPSPKTCGGYEGSFGHEEQDARTFAAWGVDYLKYDLCGYRETIYQVSKGDLDVQSRLLIETYVKMKRALDHTGRPIIFSLSPGMGGMWLVGPATGANLWRTTADIEPNYERIALIGFGQAGLSRFAGPGHWNDPDMLEIGNGKLTLDESKTHMSLWALLAAPLLAGNDLTRMSQQTLDILSNREVIAIDQDALGRQGDRVSEVGPLEIWMKPLSGNAKAVGLFNRSISPMKMTLHLHDVGLKKAHLRDLWTHKDLGVVEDSYTVDVPRYGVVLLKLTVE